MSYDTANAPAVMPVSATKTLLPLFAFSGALLMFTLEPLVGRLIVPRYGGGFYVWTTCLMFFQGVLLAGYLYAHLIAPRIGRLHWLVAALPLLVLPVDVGLAQRSAHPVLTLLATLTTHVALPIGVLATTGVLAQAWLVRTCGQDADPYWLYAASNAGSLGGLLLYPFFIEPWIGLAQQRLLWTILFLGYLLLVAYLTPGRPTREEIERAQNKPWWEQPDEYLARSTQLYWLMLSMAPSIMLVAVTNAIAFDVGSIPLAWVAPLAIYLLSFVLTFRSRPSAASRLARFWPELGLIGFIAIAGPNILPSWPTIGWQLLSLMAVCLAGHGELYRSRPAPNHLTKYYLVIATGGWAGGVFGSVLAPVLFDRLYEYPVALTLLVATLVAGGAPRLGGVFGAGRRLEGLLRVPIASAAIGVSVCLLMPAELAGERPVVLRNHYGIYQIGIRSHPAGEAGLEEPVLERYLMHNGTIHGSELLVEGGAHRHVGYYHSASGIGDALSLLARPRRLAVIGLGTGNTAAYLAAGEGLTFYELDPDDEEIARRYFDYLDASPAFVRVVLGDARVELAHDGAAPDHSYDALVVDAFSGDAIPSHLLTREALELYLTKVREDGFLLFHISNRFYDLRSVLSATGASLGLRSLYKRRSHKDGLAPFENATVYLVLTHNAAVADALVGLGWTDAAGGSHLPAARPWTDDYVNVLAPLWFKLRGDQG